jgi:hypothetical protein
MALPGGGERKLYSQILRGEKCLKRFNLTVKSKGNQSPETVKQLK